ncbi:hypothetical protein [Candidatus Hecatella orcuttiae]|uniref:hypothetical protein n=1 Tax=Candidatus Hecatella orcuttiae TaxID=1935119 RepID=UPI002867DDC1|nr:hypothetical protein [Candidatus Hecatella orcuttiae]
MRRRFAVERGRRFREPVRRIPPRQLTPSIRKMLVGDARDAAVFRVVHEGLKHGADITPCSFM